MVAGLAQGRATPACLSNQFGPPQNLFWHGPVGLPGNLLGSLFRQKPLGLIVSGSSFFSCLGWSFPGFLEGGQGGLSRGT
jgi:hypothetical protein